MIWSITASVLVESLISSRGIGDPGSTCTVSFLAPFRNGFLFPLTGDGGGNNWNWLIVGVDAVHVHNSRDEVEAEEREQGGVSIDIYSIASRENCWFLDQTRPDPVAVFCRCDNPIFSAGARISLV